MVSRTPPLGPYFNFFLLSFKKSKKLGPLKNSGPSPKTLMVFGRGYFGPLLKEILTTPLYVSCLCKAAKSRCFLPTVR